MKLNEQEKEILVTMFQKHEAAVQAKKDSEDLAKATAREAEQKERLSKIEADKLARENQKNMTVESKLSAIGLTPLEEIEKRYTDQSDLLKEAVDRDLITKQEAAKKEEEINKQKVDAIKRYEDQQRQNQKMLVTVYTGHIRGFG